LVGQLPCLAITFPRPWLGQCILDPCGFAQFGCCGCRYNHSRDDEEVYREFLEIANEIVPQILRMDHDGALARDPAVFAHLLQFYDGLCCWEEDSQTPVMHITWATHMLSSIAKFDVETRQSVELHDSRADDKPTNVVDKASAAVIGGVRSLHKRRSALRTEPAGEKSDTVPTVGEPNGGMGGLQVATAEDSDGKISSEVSPVGIEDHLTPPASEDMKMKLVVDRLTTRSDENDDGDDDEGDRSSEISALAHACAESLLNPDFLCGGGEPFVKDANHYHHQLLSSATATQVDLNAFAACTNSGPVSDVGSAVGNGSRTAVSAERRPPRLVLHSAKMSALKSLLVATKLNASAIKLHLTAQSQVARKPSSIRHPWSTHFYSDVYRRRATKRRSDD